MPSTPSVPLSLTRRNPRPLLRAVLIVAAYLFAFIILDLITKQFEELPGIVAWYPPAGLTYTLLLVFGVRFAPAVTIALLISSLFVYRMPQPPYALLLWAFIVSLIYSGAAAFLSKRIRFDWQLRKLRDVIWFVFTTVFVSALLAVLSVLSSALSSAMPRSEVLLAIFHWWIGETVGVLTITPFLLIYVMPGLKRFTEGQPVRLPAGWSFPRPTLSAIGQISSIAFTLYWVFGTRFLDEFHPLFLIALPLIWIALQRGFKGVSAAIMALNFGVVLMLLFFPFNLARLGELELLMIVNCIVGLLMGAVVTERKQAEEGLQESERGLKDAQALGRLGNWSFDLESQTIKWSEQVYQLYERDPVLGPPTPEEEATYYSPEQAQILREYSARAIKEGQSFEYDLKVNLPSGKHLSFFGTMKPVKDANGRVVKLFGTVQDVTERKRTEEQIQSQVETLGALYDLSRTLLGMADFNAILDQVTRCAVESTHVTFGRILLLEQDDLVARAVFPVRMLDQDLQVGQREPLADHPTCQHVLDENTPLVIQAGSPEAIECTPFLLGITQTLCIIPLHVHEHSFGLLLLGEARDTAREPFTVEKLHLARSIGDQAASAIQRADLHVQTERQVQRLAALHDIDSAIGSSFDVLITLNILLEHVLTQLKVDAASVLLLNPHMQTLEYTTGRGFRTEALQRTHLRMGEGFAGRAALERKLIYVPDLRGRKTDFLRSPYFLAEGFVAYYGVPLIAKGQVKGVLEVFHRLPLASEPDWVNFLETLAGQAAIAIDNTQLFDYLQRSNADLSIAYDATIEGWSAALDLRDKETEGHSLRVTEMTLQLARSLGIGEAELVHVRRGALLHDIGKMGVPDSILLKPDKLSDEEWELMRKHPQLAFDMLAPITYLKPALDIPYCHHEKWDGTGYPRGLKGEEIPLSARIFAVVDVYDALTSDRLYRKAWSKVKAMEYIREQASKHFDPKAVESFLQVVNEDT